MMRNGRLCRGNVTDFLLLAVFITLAYVFIQRRGYMKKVSHGRRWLKSRASKIKTVGSVLARKPLKRSLTQQNYISG